MLDLREGREGMGSDAHEMSPEDFTQMEEAKLRAHLEKDPDILKTIDKTVKEKGEDPLVDAE